MDTWYSMHVMQKTPHIIYLVQAKDIFHFQKSLPTIISMNYGQFPVRTINIFYMNDKICSPVILFCCEDPLSKKVSCYLSNALEVY